MPKSALPPPETPPSPTTALQTINFRLQPLCFKLRVSNQSRTKRTFLLAFFCLFCNVAQDCHWLLLVETPSGILADLKESFPADIAGNTLIWAKIPVLMHSLQFSPFSCCLSCSSWSQAWGLQEAGPRLQVLLSDAGHSYSKAHWQSHIPSDHLMQLEKTDKLAVT